MALDISKLEAEIERSTTVDAGILALLAEVEANKGDPVAIQSLVDKLRANNDSIADKLVANTPSAP